MHKEQLQQTKGFSIVELLIALAVVSIVIAVLASGMRTTLYASSESGNRMRATLIADEGLEALHALSFSSLTDGTHGITHSAGSWNLSGSSDTTDIFSRNVAISTINQTTKEAEATVSWSDKYGVTQSVSLLTYFTDWARQLAANWATPLLADTIDLSGNGDGEHVVVDGDYAYVVRSGSTPNFIVVNISNPSALSIVDTLNLSGDQYGITLGGTYAYVVGSNNSSELYVIDISNPASVSVAGTYNAPGSRDLYGVAISGNTVYAGRDQGDLLAINVTNPSTPTLLATLSLSDDVNDIYIDGSYAYTATSDNSRELEVVDISNPISPSSIGFLDLPGNANATSITGTGSHVFLGRDGSGSLDVVSIATPSTPTLTTTYATGGSVQDVDMGVSNTYLFMATSNNAGEFQILDITNLPTLTLVTSFDMPATLNGVAYSSDYDSAIVVSTGNSEEIQSVIPQ